MKYPMPISPNSQTLIMGDFFQVLIYFQWRRGYSARRMVCWSSLAVWPVWIELSDPRFKLVKIIMLNCWLPGYRRFLKPVQTLHFIVTDAKLISASTLTANLSTAQILRVVLLWVCPHIIQVIGLFIDISKRSQNVSSSTKVTGMDPSLQGTVILKNYTNIKAERLKYCGHQCLVSVDLTMANFLLGRQGGRTKHPRFLC